MRRLASLVVAAALATPIAASAHGWTWGTGTSGDGKKVTQQRAVGEFRAVRLEGSLDVRVKVGAPTAVAVTIDENLQPLVETRLDGDTLVIGTTGSMHCSGVSRVELSTPSLRAFAIEGSGDVAIEGGQGDLKLSVSGSGDLSWRGAAGKLEVEIAGSGDVKLAGSAEEARLEVAGSGDIRARALTAHSAEIGVAGSGDVELTLDGGTLRAEVAGSGDIHWYGKAQVEKASVSGSGEIARR
jgi:hypothetical protein